MLARATLAAAAVAATFRTARAALGINLGNVLEAPTEGAWAPAAQEYYFTDYLGAGFTFVRVPVRWDEHTGRAPPYAIAPAFLARVQQVVGWALARNLSAIVNTHHDDWADCAANWTAVKPRFLAIWTQVSAAFAAAPADLLSFEVRGPTAPLCGHRASRIIVIYI